MRVSWLSFTAILEQQLQTFSLADYNSINLAVQKFNKTITDVNNTHIPTGTIRHFKSLTRVSIGASNIKTRAQIRKQMPTPDVLDRIRVLNPEIAEDIKHEQTSKWNKNNYSKASHTTQTLPNFGNSYEASTSIIDTLTKRTLRRPSSHTYKQTSPQTHSKQTCSTHTTQTSADYHTDSRIGPTLSGYTLSR